eukprot:351269-Chlamydomonas_euryale.AAC.6
MRLWIAPSTYSIMQSIGATRAALTSDSTPPASRICTRTQMAPGERAQSLGAAVGRGPAQRRACCQAEGLLKDVPAVRLWPGMGSSNGLLAAPEECPCRWMGCGWTWFGFP